MRKLTSGGWPFWLGALALGLLWAYWTTLGQLSDRWAHDPQYSHGYLVPAFALFLLWQRRPMLPAVEPRPDGWGLALIGWAMVLRLTGAYFALEWLDALSLLPCLLGCAVLLGGWDCARWAWPAVAFLAFMVPLPYRIEVALSQPLRHLATLASTYVLQTLGIPALAEGNTIRLSTPPPLDVAEACSGLSMLMTFLALSTAVACVIRRRWVDKAVLLASAVPIALAVNVCRITLTGLFHELVGSSAANAVFHDWAGLLMMPVALLLLWFELWFLARLLVVPEPARPVPIGFPAAEARKSAKTPRLANQLFK
jgi:exosortase